MTEVETEYQYSINIDNIIYLKKVIEASGVLTTVSKTIVGMSSPYPNTVNITLNDALDTGEKSLFDSTILGYVPAVIVKNSRFLNGFNIYQFRDEIESEPTINATVLAIGQAGNSIHINFDTALESAELSSLNNIVENHTSKKSKEYSILKVPINAATDTGLDTPIFKKIFDSGTGGVGTAIEFTKSQEMTVSHHEDFNFVSDYTISFWLEISDHSNINSVLLHKGSAFKIRVHQKRIKFNNNLFSLQTGNHLLVGVKNHIVIKTTVIGSGVNSEVDTKIYINGTLRAQKDSDDSDDGGTLDINTTDITIGNQNNNLLPNKRLSGIIDELVFVGNSTFDIDAAYNNGEGAAITASEPDLVAGWHFNEGSGTTAADFGPGNHTAVQTIGTISWVPGLILSPGSNGNFTWVFPPGETRELFFSICMPTTYLELSNITPAIHWNATGSSAGNVVWGIEYLWKNIDDTFGNTSFEEKTIVGPMISKKYIMTEFSEIDGSDKRIFSHFIGRFYRKGSDAADTYTGEVAFLDFLLIYKNNWSSNSIVKLS